MTRPETLTQVSRGATCSLLAVALPAPGGGVLAICLLTRLLTFLLGSITPVVSWTSGRAQVQTPYRPLVADGFR